MSEINIFLAFGAGFLSFVSPCVLPLYPVFLSYITGMSISEINEENTKINKRALLHTTFFLVGFSSIFIMMGFITTFISEFLLTYQDIIRQIGAILIIFFGLVIVGVFNFEFLMKDRKIQFKNPAGRLFRFLYHRNGLFLRMDALYRTNISHRSVPCSNTTGYRDDYDDQLYPRIFDSVFAHGLFHRQTKLV